MWRLEFVKPLANLATLSVYVNVCMSTWYRITALVNSVIKWFASSENITKTCLYSFDPLKPHFYIVKLEFKGVYIIFHISAQNIDCRYSLEPPQRGGSNEYPQSMFWAECEAVLTSTNNLCFEQNYEKISEFFIWFFSVFGGKIFYIFE